MARTLIWEEIDEIADALVAAYPDTDPLDISFPRLHRMIVTLDGFADPPEAATEHRLEEIQMAWHELTAE